MTLMQNGNWTQENIDLVKSEIFKDDIVDNWLLMGSIWPILGILIVYLLFALKVGPKIMEKRKPFDLRRAILVYNLFQVFQNGRIVWLFLSHPGGVEYATKNVCYPLGRDDKNTFFLPLCDGAWYFFISKIVDLSDTVFLVLRKKRDLITVLHIYHHTNMALVTWVYLKHVKDEQMVFIGVLNSFVHVIMYSYYFLSALGPSLRKYLWWKKYITTIQIIQFVMIMAFLSALLYNKCKIRVNYTLYFIVDAFCFLILFLNFYSKTYLQPEKEGNLENGSEKKEHISNGSQIGLVDSNEPIKKIQ